MGPDTDGSFEPSLEQCESFWNMLSEERQKVCEGEGERERGRGRRGEGKGEREKGRGRGRRGVEWSFLLVDCFFFLID